MTREETAERAEAYLRELMANVAEDNAMEVMVAVKVQKSRHTATGFAFTTNAELLRMLAGTMRNIETILRKDNSPMIADTLASMAEHIEGGLGIGSESSVILGTH